MARRKPIALPPIVINMNQPCKNGQPYVTADGSCLRCGASQGVHGYACGDIEQFLYGEGGPLDQSSPVLPDLKKWTGSPRFHLTKE